jgi:hypothetical protein
LPLLALSLPLGLIECCLKRIQRFAWCTLECILARHNLASAALEWWFNPLRDSQRFRSPVVGNTSLLSLSTAIVISSDPYLQAGLI